MSKRSQKLSGVNDRFPRDLNGVISILHNEPDKSEKDRIILRFLKELAAYRRNVKQIYDLYQRTERDMEYERSRIASEESRGMYSSYGYQNNGTPLNPINSPMNKLW